MKRSFFLKIASMFFFFLFSVQFAYAWGPLTHVAINKEAYVGVYGTGSRHENDFVKAGHSADMISFWHIVRGTAKYDYAHNLIDSVDGHSILDVDYDQGYNQNGIPMFGKKILKAYKLTKYPRRFTTKDQYFAYGWIGHQLADRGAHGVYGYASSRPLFKGLPFYVEKLGNHGATELIVDAIIYQQRPDVGSYAALSLSPALVHEAAIKYYNDVNYYDASNNRLHSIKKSSVINCSQAKRMAWLWARWLPISRTLAKMASLSWWWFPEAMEYYSDYLPKYNQSVAAVADFLENPSYEIASVSHKSLSQKISFTFASFFNRLKVFFSGEKVQAEESQDSQLPETLYYTFINDVAEEAERLGALETQEEIVSTDPEVTGSTSYEFSAEVTDESAFMQALTNVINRDLAEKNPLETKLWAKFMEGLYLKDGFSFQEIITRAQDFTPPAIGDLKPGDGSFTNNPTPFVAATVTDDPLGIGLDLTSISMKLDAEEVQHTHIPELNLITYVPSSLPDGEHTIILEVSDKADNQASKTWSFTVDTIPPEIEHTVQNKIINIKNETTAKIDLSANEPVNYTIEIFRVKEMPTDKSQRGERVYLSDSGETPLMEWEIKWDGTDNNGAPVPNGVYTIRITAQDRAGNESSFEEQVNVNNAADGI